jgi:hypothetical protein
MGRRNGETCGGKMKTITVLFWIKSNRGTNDKIIFKIPEKWSKKEIETALEQWCARFGAWTHSDNIVRYGYKTVKIPNRKELLKKWHKICTQRDRVDENWKTMREMFNVREIPESWK